MLTAPQYPLKTKWPSGRAYLLTRSSCADVESFIASTLCRSRQSRDLAVGEVADQVVGNRQQVCLLHPNHAELRINLRQEIGSHWTLRFWNKR
jgi:hypothetical protein